VLPPARVGGLALLGELEPSGYREPPALVRRSDGQLIKLTPLLYHLLDLMDGRRGHEELARALGRRVGRRATADDVRFLIDHRLAPLGLLQRPDGRETEMARANPLLVLRPRFVISRPELTRRVTAPFLWLFAPPVMIALLSSFAAVVAWLVIDKGLSSALHQAFYEPVLILVVWALIVLSAAFHEIGHAAACRYGGARPGAMGGGLYMIWPAFYTEASDAYRLDRRARLRVDLGGLYFSAIFAVATAGLWLVTGVDALLLVVAVQLVQVARQLVPFIRADGYHILADLIGVPDLFAHIKPTLLGLLPTRRGRSQEQALKPWARAVVTAWVLVTIPVLVAVLGLIILAFPRVAATAWDSMGLQWVQATAYWGAGDPAGVAASVISLGVVALPVVGIVYFVAYLAQRIARWAWRRTAGQPVRRGVALLVGGALVGLLAWAWWPSESYRPIDPSMDGLLPVIFGAQGVQPGDVGGRTNARAVAPVSVRPPAHGGEAHLRLVSLPELGTGFSIQRRPPPPREGPAGVGDRPAWPFPFAPPSLAKSGDNRALAVNTTDSSTLWDIAISMLVLADGASVRHANEAHAYANCEDCLTGAVAFQLLLIIGQMDEIVPLNAAVAANYRCRRCHTFAFAYQIVATLATPPDRALRRRLDASLQPLRDLEAGVGSLTPSQIHRLLEAAERDILRALADSLAAEAASAAPPVASHQPKAPPITHQPPPSAQTPSDRDDGHTPGQGQDRTSASAGTTTVDGAPEESDVELSTDEAPLDAGAQEPPLDAGVDEGATDAEADEAASKAPAHEAAIDADASGSPACTDVAVTHGDECPGEPAPAEDQPRETGSQPATGAARKRPARRHRRS
jgi:putative peptide zinc metalloprotease protein